MLTADCSSASCVSTCVELSNLRYETCQTIVGLSHYRDLFSTCKQHTPLGTVRAPKKPISKQVITHEDDDEYQKEEKEVAVEIVTDPSKRNYKAYPAMDELDDYDDVADDLEDELQAHNSSKKSTWY